ncbi:STAS domain-containing protein [Undibacterium sp. LX40W]|uniref:STAS domain-containing protein n=1 Tax=Undibacterium nitidum TaxID=2762298 RepID=A0A923HQ31_9BURK|nr:MULTISPECIES: STAS domain-containing protein [Undibacterium]MBC3882493.1 STAS domain-containing protein [Undibacterium nitidum]MBC3892774.1 STAS domain-containing protein [Undibacterium sp. LX40W]
MVLTEQELNLSNAVTVSQAGLRAIEAGSREIDLSSLQNVDSSAVAVMLSWQRHAQAQQRALSFTGVPASLQSLIALYGLQDFFHMVPISSAERH